MASECGATRLYCQRDARSTALYRLVEKYYEEVKGLWEERFEGVYGRWRGFVDDLVNRYLDCGVHDCGFCRVRCPSCRAEYLVAFSCQTRTFCPSCAAKRSAIFSSMLQEEVLAPVGHWMVTFTVPKMLRPYFLHHRKLLGKLARASWETVQELMVEVVGEEGFQPGMVVSVHTASASMGWHPHAHALVPRGGWLRDGTWVPVPYMDELAAEKLFRHKVLSFLKDEDLVSEERVELLLSWRHTGFSVDFSVRIEPEDSAAVERVSRYILRSPLSLERMELDGAVLHYRSKDGSSVEHFDPLDFLARVLMQAPEPRLHLVRYYGKYSSRARGERQEEDALEGGGPEEKPRSEERRRLRRSWARMIAKIYEVSPLLCECGVEMKVVAFITEHAVIHKILGHVRRSQPERGRAPPIA